MMLLFDVLLAIAVIGLALYVVLGRSLFAAVVVYAVFGLLMAVIWARLGAPDLALAEAAIGAGLTGAMLMLAYRRLVAIKPWQALRPVALSSALAWPVALACAGLAVTLVVVLQGLPWPEDKAGDQAIAALEDSAIGNPVTGVLLMFRGFDTLLEMQVLLVAWLGAVVAQQTNRTDPPVRPADVPLVGALLAIVLPVTVLVAGYLLQTGGQAPGGAFQAGAVLAAAAVLLSLAGRLQPLATTPWPVAGLLVLGLLLFAVVGLLPMWRGQAAMHLEAIWLIYLVETAMTISIATALALLFLGSAGMETRR